MQYATAVDRFTGSPGSGATVRVCAADGSFLAMERILKWLDDLDDFLAVTRLQAGPLLVTITLLAVFLAVLGVVFVLGPPDLHAAP